jgi:FAD/FMN-containing dehydrogenase
MKPVLAGWGRYPRHASELVEPHSPAALARRQAELGPFVARGAGRAYGDAAIGTAATVATGQLNRMLRFDADEGLLTVEAGVTLEAVIEVFLPRGWFVPVVPGTRFVTIGGMIAADVHGKNHHCSGGFGAHVRALRLLLPSGEAATCSPTENPQLFAATIGGMGLTGVILEATFALMRVETGWIRQNTVVTENLAATFRALAEAEAAATYSVAWIDGAARGPRLGRGVVFLGEHAAAGDAPDGRPPRRKGLLSVPADLPQATLNRWSVAAFNELYWRKAALGGRRALVRWDRYFFPLDAIGDWNRLYGRAGFLQHQCVLPGGAEPLVAEILDRVAAAGHPSFLAVLKTLRGGVGMLSFPTPGVTLAVDLRATPQVLALLEDLDRLVVAAGGRLYLAKDARQSAETFRAGYPQLAAFEALRRDIGATGRLSSHLSERLAIA